MRIEPIVLESLPANKQRNQLEQLIHAIQLIHQAAWAASGEISTRLTLST